MVLKKRQKYFGYSVLFVTSCPFFYLHICVSKMFTENNVFDMIYFLIVYLQNIKFSVEEVHTKALAGIDIVPLLSFARFPLKWVSVLLRDGRIRFVAVLPGILLHFYYPTPDLWCGECFVWVGSMRSCPEVLLLLPVSFRACLYSSGFIARRHYSLDSLEREVKS